MPAPSCSIRPWAVLSRQIGAGSLRQRADLTCVMLVLWIESLMQKEDAGKNCPVSPNPPPIGYSFAHRWVEVDGAEIGPMPCYSVSDTSVELAVVLI